MKKIFNFIFVVMAIAMISFGTAKAEAAVKYKVGSETYNISTSKGTATLLKSNTTSDSISLGSLVRYNGKVYKLTKINADAFANNSNIKSIIIPDTVTKIGSRAFANCKNLTTISGGENVKSRGKDIIKGCKKITVYCAPFNYLVRSSSTVGLKSIYGPSSSSLTSVNIPNTITFLGKKMKVTAIYPSVFEDLPNLKSVTCGKYMKVIGAHAFENCCNLSSFTCKSSLLNKIRAKAFYGDESLSSITLTTTKLTNKSIGNKAFYGVSGKSLTLPSSKVSSYKSIFSASGMGKTKSYYRTICKTGGTSAQRKKINKMMMKLPYWMTEMYVRDGWTIKIVNYIGKSGWKNCDIAGDCSGGTKTINIASSCGGISSTVLIHEMGHYVDYKLGSNGKNSSEVSNNFASVFASEQSIFLKHFNWADGYATKDNAEAFAETFTNYYNKNSSLKKYCPNLYNYVQKEVSALKYNH